MKSLSLLKNERYLNSKIITKKIIQYIATDFTILYNVSMTSEL